MRNSTRIDPVSLDNLMGRARPESRWRAPVDPRVRWGSILSGPLLAFVGGLVIALMGRYLPGLVQRFHGSLWLDLLAIGAASLMITDALAFIAWVVLLVGTRGLGEATAGWLRFAFAVSMVGAVNMFLLALLAVMAAAGLLGLILVAAVQVILRFLFVLVVGVIIVIIIIASQA